MLSLLSFILLILCVICLLCCWSFSFSFNTKIYTIQEIPNFLTNEECELLIKLSEPNLIESKVYTHAEDDSIDTSHRKSEQCWLKDNRHQVIENISKRVASLTNTQKDLQEDLQVVKYTTGGFFNPHYDACNGDKDFCKRMDGEKGPRYITFLIYLNDDFTGGETVFPNINKSVKPEKGKAVIFYNIDKDTKQILQDSFHGGNPVISGQKWICNKWIKRG